MLLWPSIYVMSKHTQGLVTSPMCVFCVFDLAGLVEVLPVFQSSSTPPPQPFTSHALITEGS